MALVTCPDCGSQISDAAPACPKCGRPMHVAPPPLATRSQTAKPKKRLSLFASLLRFCFYAFILLVVVIVVASFFDHDDKGGNSTPATAPSDAASVNPPPEREQPRHGNHSGEESALYRASKMLSGDSDSGRGQDEAAPAAPIVASAPEIFQRYDANEVAADQYFKGHVLQITSPVASIDKDFTGSVNLKLPTGNEFAPMEASLVDGQESVAGGLSPGQVVTLQCRSVEKILMAPVASKCTIISP